LTVANDAKHEHPGGEIPHRHNADDELATHRSTSDVGHARASEQQVLELREEELEARKEAVETGQVRIGKDVVAESRTLEVPVTREEVTIQRRPVEGRPAEGSIGDDADTLRVPVREDRVTAEKRVVVTEEISVGKQQVQDTERVSGTVRREEARIDIDGDVEVDERR
jgi:uncharacterized protein (TIGR02271 family)